MFISQCLVTQEHCSSRSKGSGGGSSGGSGRRAGGRWRGAGAAQEEAPKEAALAARWARRPDSLRVAAGTAEEEAVDILA
jgi:hypothetical protein